MRTIIRPPDAPTRRSGGWRTAGRINRAVIDLAEAAMLRDRVGERFAAVVTDADDGSVRIQLRDAAVAARLPDRDLAPGDAVEVRLVVADPVKRLVTFARA